MATTASSDTATAVRPKSLSPESLAKRAAIGLLLLTVGIFAAVWLYHSSISADFHAETTRAAAFAERE